MEHGSAKWGDAASICKRYRDKRYTQNLILTQNFRMGLDCYKHKRNLNVLVVGGSGAGKSRAYAVVNIMQCNCSMVVTDPKGELLRKTGGLLEREGYEVRVFDLINPETSFCYNPFAYVRDDKDVLKLELLERQGMEQEKGDMIRMADHIDTMEMQLGTVLKELGEVKKQLGVMQESKVKLFAVNTIQKAEHQVQTLRFQVGEWKRKFVERAEQAVLPFLLRSVGNSMGWGNVSNAHL